MTDSERRTAAARFAADWKGRGDEKQETQAFWLALLQKVYGVDEPEKYVSFELPVKLDHTSFIDGYIEATRVLIEQKGKDIDLRACLKSSNEDGNEGKNENLSRNKEFALTIFPKSAEFVEPAEKTLYHPAARQHNKLV